MNSQTPAETSFLIISYRMPTIQVFSRHEYGKFGKIEKIKSSESREIEDVKYRKHRTDFLYLSAKFSYRKPSGNKSFRYFLSFSFDQAPTQIRIQKHRSYRLLSKYAKLPKDKFCKINPRQGKRRFDESK